MDIDKILTDIRKPARYTGGELNSVNKDWKNVKFKMCICYPDLYEIGMSYLGLHILYGLINSTEECVCERCFSPWTDMEERLKKDKELLFALESRRPLNNFDVVGFSFAYELLYTNVLNILGLGGIKIRASERGGDQPIVIAGGPCAFNPAPMSDFIDIFFIGDAEESIIDFISLFKKLKAFGRNRKGILKEAANIQGLYVPAFHDISKKVRKRIVKDINNSYYPVNPVIPYIKTVHDRVSVEIMRGCPNNCRFCQARSIYHPVRVKNKEKVISTAKEILSNTGYGEISFMSLSSSNHPFLVEIIDEVNKEFKGKAVNVSVPSLRVEDLCSDIPQKIAENRKTGLTFAPESGSPDLREKINKEINVDKLYTAVENAFKAGWRRVKLYFMIGLPGETQEDVDGIAEIAKKVSYARIKVDGRKADVTVSVNSFIPKPHTAFQWRGMDSLESLSKKRVIIRKGIKDKCIKLDFNNNRSSVLEAALARGGNELNDIIYTAWRNGARLDAWNECLNMTVWEEAFKKYGSSIYDAAVKDYRLSDSLPWDIIDVGIDKRTFIDEAKKAGITA